MDVIRRLIFLFPLLISVVACSEDPNIAIETAVAGTMDAQIVQTGVAATQEAAHTPTPPLNYYVSTWQMTF